MVTGQFAPDIRHTLPTRPLENLDPGAEWWPTGAVDSSFVRLLPRRFFRRTARRLRSRAERQEATDADIYLEDIAGRGGMRNLRTIRVLIPSPAGAPPAADCFISDRQAVPRFG